MKCLPPWPHLNVLEREGQTRVLKMMQSVAQCSSENRMTHSAVAACMAPLLLRPLLAGECDLEDDLDTNGDCSAQILAAANAAKNAQGIIRILLEEHENIFDEQWINLSFPSVNYKMEDSGSEDSTNDDRVKVHDDGYHAEYPMDQEITGHLERVDSGNLSGSSGHDASDLYNYKVWEGAESDDEFYKEICLKKLNKKSPGELTDAKDFLSPLPKCDDNFLVDKDIPICEPYGSIDNFPSSLGQKLIYFHGHESCTEEAVSKIKGSIPSTMHSTFGGRSGAKKINCQNSLIHLLMMSVSASWHSETIRCNLCLLKRSTIHH